MKQLTLPNGKSCCYLDKLTALESYNEVYEEQEYFQFGLKIPDDAIVFDIGANIGNFSRYVVEHHPSAHVYAFEPVPQIFEVYSANLKEYPDRIHSYNIGLAEKPGEMTIDYFPRLSADSSIVPFVRDDKVAYYAENWEAFTQGNKIAGMVPQRLRRHAVTAILKYLYKPVPTKCHLRPLSDIISESNISKIDFMKLDAENYEDHVIAGIADEHWPLIKQVAMEVHQHISGGDDLVQKFTRLLESQGFSVNLGKEFLAPGSNVFMLYAKQS